MSEGEPDEETMARLRAAQQRLEAGGGYRWRDDVLAVLRGLGFGPEQARAPALDLLRRRADPRLAGPRAGHPPRPAAARRAHQPPRHPLAGVAGALPGRPRRRRRPRRPRPLVPRGGRHLGAGAGGPARPLLRRPLARLAQGAGGARRSPSARRSSASRRRSSGWSASSSASATRRPRPNRRSRGSSRSTRSSATGRRPNAATRRNLRFSFKPPERPGRVVLKLVNGEDRGAGPDPARRRRARSRARRARRPRRPQRQPARRP